MYRRCSQQWYYRYILGIKSRPAIALSNGKAGHTAVEADNRAMMKNEEGVGLPTEQVLDIYSDAFDADLAEIESELDGTDDPGAVKDGTVQTLKVYKSLVAPRIKPAAVELGFSLDIPPAEDYEYPIKIVEGRIDLVEHQTVGVYDYKFPLSRRAKSQEEADLSWQLTLYDTVLENAHNINTENLGFIAMLPPGKRDPADIKVTRRSKEQMTPEWKAHRRERLLHAMRTAQRAIDAGIHAPVDDPKVCSWCGYRDICQTPSSSKTLQDIRRKQHEAGG